MRGLNVYCCPTCGHYGFFQLVANAVCPHCSIAMTPLPIPYQDFMDLDYPQRQVLISRHMINAAIPCDTSAPARAPFASPPETSSKTTLRNKADSTDKAKSAGRRKSSGRRKVFDTTPSPDGDNRSDGTASLNTNNAEPPGKAEARSKTTSTGRSKSLSKIKSGDSTVDTVSADKRKSTDSTFSPDKPVSTSSKSHPDISKDSDRETLYQEVLTLREKNEQLEQTVSWMHDLIWELTRRLHITQNT